MDVSSFMGGSYLTHLDLPQPSQVWSIRDVKQELVGSDQKVVVYFSEHQKGLGLNKVNLRTIAQVYTVQSATWIGKQLELFKDKTQFQGKVVDCVRVRIPPQSSPTQAAASSQRPATAPVNVTAAQPVAAPSSENPAPWEQDDSSPPSA